MGDVKFVNNAVTTLLSSVSIDDVTFVVSSAATFPVLGAGDWMYVTIESEFVKVTATSGATFTCDPITVGHAADVPVELRMCEQLLDDFATDEELSVGLALKSDKASTYVDNDCIGGNFDNWQRGTSQTSSGYGSDDRFSNVHIGSTKVHSRQSHGIGQTDVPGNPRYFSRTVVTSSAGAGNYVRKIHKILDVRKYSGKTVAVKFHGKADSTKNIAIDVEQHFGPGGSGPVYGISDQKVELTSSFAKNVLFFTIPSISGKTVEELSYTQFNFWFDAGSDLNTRTDTLGQQSGTFEISEVEIYESDVELLVRRRTAKEELRLSQPYGALIYSSTGANTSFASGYWYSTGVYHFGLPLPVSLISEPNSITVGTVSDLRVRSNGSTNVPTSVTYVSNYEPTSVILPVEVAASGGAAGYPASLGGFSSIFVDAEP